MRTTFVLALVVAFCALLSVLVVQAEEGRLQVGQIKPTNRRAEETEEKSVKASLPKIQHPSNSNLVHRKRKKCTQIALFMGSGYKLQYSRASSFLIHRTSIDAVRSLRAEDVMTPSPLDAFKVAIAKFEKKPASRRLNSDEDEKEVIKKFTKAMEKMKKNGRA
ncbi:hypothetical protein F441_21527 [Phytophthora nicotianae CJ01A1]|uniref:RxLR effector protein n=3 Tax=Phytophthora nicotianae TaxID=4792 RepID=W2VUY9_PHYNI|nr:hypothetical protein L916_20914 [Phytophthora nicotianae]ETP01184.1 hypothetical protein F441_21527 [Phytophthora nicotianae CJ01A1]